METAPEPDRETALEPDLEPDRTTNLPTSGLTIAGALRLGLLDAELAGLLWVLVDGGVPVVVAGPGGDPADHAARAATLGALLDLVPATRSGRTLAGEAEDFTWLGSAERLGWQRATAAGPRPAEPATTLILAGELGLGPPADTTGDRARLVVRSLGLGFSLAATIEGTRLEDVLATLRRRPIRLTDDELSNLGVVVVLGARVEAGPSRVTSAHYLRPLARDAHGHPQRLPPAVLTVWDERIARFEHFAWGIAGELAARVGRRTGDFELERDRRAAVLVALAAAGRGTPRVDDVAGIRAALERGRVGGIASAGSHGH